MMIHLLDYMILVALCAASISYTICVASIFKSIREWISKYHSKLEDLIHCPYCFCHYVILIIMLTTSNIESHLVPITKYIIYNFLFTWLCIVCITSMIHYIMLKAYIPIREYMKDRKLEQFKQRKHE